jgi:hypothetical protein
MPGIVDFVQRAPFLERVSALSEHREKLDADGMLTALRSEENIVDIAKRYGLLDDEEEERHLREDWYDETGSGWWPGHPVAEIVRHGYILMIEEANRHDLPVDAIWIPNQDAFRIAICRSPAQITMIFYTPSCMETRAGDDETIRVAEWDGENVIERHGRRLARDAGGSKS